MLWAVPRLGAVRPDATEHYMEELKDARLALEVWLSPRWKESYPALPGTILFT